MSGNEYIAMTKWEGEEKWYVGKYNHLVTKTRLAKRFNDHVKADAAGKAYCHDPWVLDVADLTGE